MKKVLLTILLIIVVVVVAALSYLKIGLPNVGAAPELHVAITPEEFSMATISRIM